MYDGQRHRTGSDNGRISPSLLGRFQIWEVPLPSAYEQNDPIAESRECKYLVGVKSVRWAWTFDLFYEWRLTHAEDHI